MCTVTQWASQPQAQFMLRSIRKGWDTERARRVWGYMQWRKERHLDAFCEHFGELAELQLAAEGRGRVTRSLRHNARDGSSQ